MDNDAKMQGMPNDMITLQRFMNDNSLKGEHQKILQKLDRKIETQVIAKDHLKNPPRAANPAIFG